MVIKMELLNVSAFGNFTASRLDKGTVYLLQNARVDSFYEYSKYFRDEGFEKKEERMKEGRNFAAYLLENTGVFINYFDGTHELYIVVEEDTKYFSYVDKKRNISVVPQFTHVGLDLFGMSYAVRLSDGRFVVFDGGTAFTDAEYLLKVLKVGTKEEKPVIAAWFITHPHADHYLGMKFFLENFMDQVIIESFMYNFPRIDDYEHFPFLGAFNSINDSCVTADCTQLFELMRQTGADIYTAHTGQEYKISDVNFEILVSVDDVMNTLATDNVNATSLAVRFEIAGQTVLLMGDNRASDSKIVKKYGKYLKCDIFQVPHHGYKSGTHSAEMRLYDLADPVVCLLPNGEKFAYESFAPFRSATAHLFTKLDFDEFIVGGPTRTLSLPYTPPSYAKDDFRRRLESGINSNGSRVCVFSGLDTSDPRALEFTFSSFIYWGAEVSVDILFEDPKACVQDIKMTVSGNSVKKLSITDDLLGDREKEIPQNSVVTVRIKSNNPIVVSNATKAADYIAPNVF